MRLRKADDRPAGPAGDGIGSGHRDSSGGSGLSRRGFLGRATALSAGAAAVHPLATGDAAVAAAPPAVAPVAGENLVRVVLRVNGKAEELTLDPRVTLLDALRERLGLTGTKKGCDRGQCGACTVHVAGRRVVSCLTLAASVNGRDVTTIEGLADGGDLTPVQQAFIDCDGLQCGFCTSGQIMSATALLRERKLSSDAEIREGMSGNICRCGAYANIVDAVRTAASGRGGGAG
jgi:xanthine dehydrogenase YagT iron-sulfur-binding subunit